MKKSAKVTVLLLMLGDSHPAVPHIHYTFIKKNVQSV